MDGSARLVTRGIIKPISAIKLNVRQTLTNHTVHVYVTLAIRKTTQLGNVTHALQIPTAIMGVAYAIKAIKRITVMVSVKS